MLPNFETGSILLQLVLAVQLKSKAVEKAKTQAEFLLKPLNQQITGAIHIVDKSHETYGHLEGVVQGIAVRGYSANGIQKYEAPTIEFTPIKVESEVSIKFAIK